VLVTLYFQLPISISGCIFLQSIDELFGFMKTWSFTSSFAICPPLGNRSEYIHMERVLRSQQRQPPPLFVLAQLLLNYFRYERVLEYSFRHSDEYSNGKLLVSCSLIFDAILRFCCYCQWDFSGDRYQRMCHEQRRMSQWSLLLQQRRKLLVFVQTWIRREWIQLFRLTVTKSSQLLYRAEKNANSKPKNKNANMKMLV